MNEIPYGYCHCGCGQKTSIVTVNVATRGLVKGEPRRFIMRHAANLQVKKSVAERLWVNIDKSGGVDACWNWATGLDGRGYGQIRGEHKMLKSHRVVYELTYGLIPDGLWVLHKCDNRACCNPKHLFLGTAIDNIQDKVQKGRQAKGERNAAHKLTWDKVRYIRSRHAEGGITYQELALQMGVTPLTIKNIVNNKTWVVKCGRCGDLGYLSIAGDDACECPECNKTAMEVMF